MKVIALKRDPKAYSCRKQVPVVRGFSNGRQACSR